MIRAACHCGEVRFEIAEPPAWVLDCNCSLCRRYGALWSYYHGDDQAKLLNRPDPDATEEYRWNDRMISFRRCRTCGCMTHMQTVDTDPPIIFGVNARMMVGLDPARVNLRQIDNGHTGFFWTRSDQAPLPSRHPPMPPDEWR